MADTETSGTTLLDYLREPVESVSDAPLAEGSLPPDESLDDTQSAPAEEEVAPDPQPDEPETADQPDEVAPPEEVSSPEPPVAEPVDWDSDQNPHLKAAQQLQEIQRLAAEQQAKRDAEAADERYRKAMKGLIEVDESDVDALAGDLIEDIRETAVQPFQQQIDVLAHGMTALVSALSVLPPEQLAAVRAAADENRKLGATAEAIESAHAVRSKAMQEANGKLSAAEKQITVLKAQLAKQAIAAQGADRADVAVTSAANGASDEPTDMYSYLRAPDQNGRFTNDAYGRQRRTG